MLLGGLFAFGFGGPLGFFAFVLLALLAALLVPAFDGTSRRPDGHVHG